jgi:hypothetical protein
VKRILDQVRGAFTDLIVSKLCGINKRNAFYVPQYDVCSIFMFDLCFIPVGCGA